MPFVKFTVVRGTVAPLAGSWPSGTSRWCMAQWHPSLVFSAWRCVGRVARLPISMTRVTDHVLCLSDSALLI